MPPLVLAEQQIIIGPNYPNHIEGRLVRTLNTPWGRFDIGALVSALPAEQQPDITIVLSDAFQNCVPVNLGAVPGHKVLLVADTHHGNVPLRTLLDYARREPFDRIVLTHDPHHLHWFMEADIAPTTYIPNVNCAYHYFGRILLRRCFSRICFWQYGHR